MPPAAAEFAALLSDAMRGQPYDVALDRARRLVNERRFALGVQLIDRRRDPLEVAAGYARVAEGTLVALGEAAVAEFEQAHGRFPGGELMVLGLGRLGGCALTHASDLDLIYLHTAPAEGMSDGDKPLGPNDYFNRLASRVTAALSVPTAAGPLYDVDTRLRPEGATGMLLVSLDAFEHYQRDHAWTWEHMALCRARPLFGSAEARDRAAGDCRDILRIPRDAAKITRDAVKMRADMERHKPPQSNLDVKLGPGGLVDLEFAVHVLQLTRHIGLDTAARGRPRPARGRRLGSGKHCGGAKVAHAHFGDDAPRRARRGQADRRTPGTSSPTRAALPIGTRCLPSMTPRGNASRQLWNNQKEARDDQ